MAKMIVRVGAAGPSAAYLSQVHSNLLLAAGAGGITHIETVDDSGQVHEWIIDKGSHEATADMHVTHPGSDALNAAIEFHLKSRP